MSQQFSGYLFPKIDLRDYKLCSSKAQQNYPKEFILSNLPKVKDQKDVNSCCAHALSSALEYFAENKYNLSTNFIYGIQGVILNKKQQGMYLSDACKIATHYGDTLEEDCSGNNEVPVCHKIAKDAFQDKKIMEKAINFKLESYYTCETENDIKFALMNYGPVLGAIYWNDNYTFDKDFCIKFKQNDNTIGHAILICGWNDKGWIIQNSWGENFGNNGRFILPYNQKIIEAKALIDFENDNDKVLIKPKLNKITDFSCKAINKILNVMMKRG